MQLIRKIVLLYAFLMLGLYACDRVGINYKALMDVSHYDKADCVDNLSAMDIPDGGVKTLYYNFHCTASIEGKDLSKQFWLDFFKYDRGWSRPGYNGIIMLDGSLDTLIPFDLDGYTEKAEISYGVKGKNMYSLNFAYVGGVDKHLNAKDTRTEAQKRTIKFLVNQIKCSDPRALIMGHREHSPDLNGNGVIDPNEFIKQCPSFSVAKEFGHLNPVINMTHDFDFSERNLNEE